jgi:hypothetical protein
VTEAVQPILVLPVYRGGPRFARALGSLARSEQYFARIIVSLNGPRTSDDMTAITDYIEKHSSKVEIVCTGEEIPWMPHQYFWMSHLERTGTRPTDWIYWFAHDDEIRPAGIAAIIDEHGNWPLEQGTIYLGPWGMRHERGDVLFDGPRDVDIESWTSFPPDGPLRLPVADWIAGQLIQPTYINMSGCITTLSSFQALRQFRVQKPGGMRIEMAAAAAPSNRWVVELPEPVVITYGRPNSDRTQYAKVARQDDRHIITWLLNYMARHPAAIIPLTRAFAHVAFGYLKVLTGRGRLPEEDWRRRSIVSP